MTFDPGNKKSKRTKGLSFFNYLQSELRRGYLLENDEERYAAKREKVYTFFRIPREIEKFLAYGYFQSADSFLFVLTFLPIRFALALSCLITRPIKKILGYGRNTVRLMKPAEIVDLLKGALLIVCCYAISYIDTSVCYHMIKTQSTMKLYIFFNMLDIADRLMSAFGQDTLDALFWTATEPRDRKREHFGVVFHFVVASLYVGVHSTIVLLQALTLNVAINSDNKGLLTIVISNNFVELKAAVFKKFDRNNLLQISCSDVRERFHICVLLFVVVIQTMKEYSWKEERLWILLPDCLLVLGTELMIDWLKHAFITRFNDIPVDAYRDYTLLIAYDLITCKQKYAYSDHSDLVARRMGFIPLPLGVVIFRILSQCLKISNVIGFLILVVAFLCLLTFRVLNGIIILGKAYDLINKAEIQRSRNVSESMDKGSSKTSLDVPSLLSCKIKTSNDNDFVEKEGQKTDLNSKKRLGPKMLSVTLRATPEIIRSPDPYETPPSPQDNDSPSLTFLGESKSGLFANSMVNLSSVGINRGVCDQEETTTQITQDISPDISLERNFDSITYSDTNNGKEISDEFSVPPSPTTSNSDVTKDCINIVESPASTPAFMTTQSCPCFSDIQSQTEQNHLNLSEHSEALDANTVKRRGSTETLGCSKTENIEELKPYLKNKGETSL